MKAQTRAVLELLRLRGADGLTPAEAREALATDRLAARVWELIHLHGYPIEKVMERSPMGAAHARYYLEARPVPYAGVQEGLPL
jgi:hypothetical protein